MGDFFNLRNGITNENNFENAWSQKEAFFKNKYDGSVVSGDAGGVEVTRVRLDCYLEPNKEAGGIQDNRILRPFQPQK